MAIRQPQTIFKLCVCVCVCTHVIFIQVSKDPDYFYENMEIHVKISMDGAQYSRSSSFCLLSFSIFNREYTLSPASKFLTKNCENPYYMNEYMYTDMHTVAVMQAEETYENLATSFQSVLLGLLGLNKAHSKYACVWCNVAKHQR